MATTFQRYLLREVIHHWIWVTGVLWVVLLVNQMVRYLGQAASGDMPGEVIFTLVGLISVSFLVKLLPLSLFLGILLALGRLYKDNEMTVFAACGAGNAQVYRPLMMMAALVAAVLTWMAMSLVPVTETLRFETRQLAEQQMDVDFLAAGRFQEASDGRIVIYTESLSPDRMQLGKIFVQGRRKDLQGILTADHARIDLDPSTGRRYLVLENGYRYEGFPGEADFRVMRFREHGYRLSPGTAAAGTDRREARPTTLLWSSNRNEDKAELQSRFSPALATLVLTFLAVPLGRTSPRQGQYARVVAGVLLFIIYYNLLGTAQIWVSQGTIPAHIGMWWVHLLPVAAGLMLLRSGIRRPPRTARGKS